MSKVGEQWKLIPSSAPGSHLHRCPHRQAHVHVCILVCTPPYRENGKEPGESDSRVTKAQTEPMETALNKDPGPIMGPVSLLGSHLSMVSQGEFMDQSFPHFSLDTVQLARVPGALSFSSAFCLQAVSHS